MAIANNMSMVRRFSVNTIAGFTGPLRALYQHWDLIKLLFKRDVALRTSGTALGGLWMVLQPALQVIALWFLMGVVLRVRFPGMVPFLDYFLTGIVVWFFILEVLTRNLTVLTEFSSLYERTAFPLNILPLLPALVSAAIYGAVYVVVVGVLQGPVYIPAALLIICGALVWLIPFCYLLSVLGLFLKDAGKAFSFVLTIAMYLTPILYMPQILPESVRVWMVLNPFADLMAVVHFILQDMPLTAGNLWRPWILWFLLLAPSWVIFRRSESHMRERL